MLVSLRRKYGQLITPGGQLLLLFIGAKIGTREGWLYCLPLIAVLSLLAWRSALNRLRAIRDTPTSKITKITSAAQGYVELIGRGMAFGDTPLLSRLRQLPYLWYRYKIEERYRTKDGEKWRTIDSGESPDSFMLSDVSGECVVDPEQAEISTISRDHWSNSDQRFDLNNDGELDMAEWMLARKAAQRGVAKKCARHKHNRICTSSANHPMANST